MQHVKQGWCSSKAGLVLQGSKAGAAAGLGWCCRAARLVQQQGWAGAAAGLVLTGCDKRECCILELVRQPSICHNLHKATKQAGAAGMSGLGRQVQQVWQGWAARQVQQAGLSGLATTYLVNMCILNHVLDHVPGFVAISSPGGSSALAHNLQTWQVSKCEASERHTKQ